MRNITRGLLLAALALAGCDGSDDPDPADRSPTDGQGQVVGRLDRSPGNQSVAPRTSMVPKSLFAADTVVVARLDGQVLGRAPIDADGRFAVAIDGGWDEPLRVVAQQADEPVAEALVAGGILAGDSVTAPPVSIETDLEARVYAALRSAYGDAVDPIGVMTRITAEMATSVVDEPRLAEAVYEAEAAYRSALGLSPQALSAARAVAWPGLVVALDQADGPDEAAVAWTEHRFAVWAAIAAAAEADAANGATAAQAAAFSLAVRMKDGPAAAPSLAAATAAAAWAEREALEAATEGSVGAEVEAAFEAFDEDLRRAQDEPAVAAARAALDARLTQGADSVLGLALAAPVGDAVAIGALLEATADDAAAAAAPLYLALARDDGRPVDGEGAAMAFVDFKAALRAALTPRLGTLVDSAALDLATGLHAAAQGATPVAIATPDVALDGGVLIGAALDGLVGLQVGADALVEGLLEPLPGDVTVVLATLAGTTVTETSLNPDGTFQLPVPEGATGPHAVSLLAAGEVLGVVFTDEVPEPDETLALPPISAETTVEAAAIAAAGLGNDRALIMAAIDGPTAAAAVAAGEIEALVEASTAACFTLADALDAEVTLIAEATAPAADQLEADLATGAMAPTAAHAAFRDEMNAALAARVGASLEEVARAQLAAMTVFELVVDALSDDPTTLAAVDARAQIDAAAAAVTGLSSTLLPAEVEALSAGVAKLRVDTREAADADAIAAVGADFEATAEALVQGRVATLSEVDAAAPLVFEELASARAAARAALVAALGGAVIVDGVDEVDQAATANNALIALGAFELAVESAFDAVVELPTIAAADVSALVALTTWIDLGRFAAAR